MEAAAPEQCEALPQHLLALLVLAPQDLAGPRLADHVLRTGGAVGGQVARRLWFLMDPRRVERILRNLGELAGSRQVVLREGAGRETVVIHRALFAVSFCYKHI